MKELSRVLEGNDKIINLDLLDKKILKALFSNKRQSFKKIGEKVRASKETVNYRINRLKNKGILQGTIAIIDNTKLEYNMHIMYLKLQKINQKREQEIIKYFVDHPFVKAIATCTGNWDMFLVFSSRNIFHYNQILREFENFCNNNLKQFKIATLLKEYFLPYNYLHNENHSSQKTTQMISKNKMKSIDVIDFQILNQLSKNSMINVIEIAKIVSLTPEAISYRIKRLIKSQIIVNFCPLINISRLGYHWYTVTLNLKNATLQRETKLVNYLKQIPQITCLIKTVGQWQIEIDVHVKSSHEFRSILMKIREDFSDIINDFESNLIFNDYKYTHMPKGLLNID